MGALPLRTDRGSHAQLREPPDQEGTEDRLRGSIWLRQVDAHTATAALLRLRGDHLHRRGQHQGLRRLPPAQPLRLRESGAKPVHGVLRREHRLQLARHSGGRRGGVKAGAGLRLHQGRRGERVRPRSGRAGVAAVGRPEAAHRTGASHRAETAGPAARRGDVGPGPGDGEEGANQHRRGDAGTDRGDRGSPHLDDPRRAQDRAVRQGGDPGGGQLRGADEKEAVLLQPGAGRKAQRVMINAHPLDYQPLLFASLDLV